MERSRSSHWWWLLIGAEAQCGFDLGHGSAGAASYCSIACGSGPGIRAK